MSGQDTKPRWSSAAPRAKFGGGTALRFGGGFWSSPKPTGPTSGLEEVMFQANPTSAKMLMQYRDGMEKVATFAGKDFGGTGGPMAATAIRKRQEPLGSEPEEPTGDDLTPGSIKMIKWKVK